jgi:hypothetical protein
MRHVTRLRVALALALATAVALSLVASACGSAQASARLSSGYGQVGMEPLEGPVGITVQVGITLSFSTPTAYILRASPSGNTILCDNAKPIPGAAPVIINDQGGHGEFTWPAALGPGLYSVCATPPAGTGQTAYSQQTFTVLDPNAPPPTIAPIPGAEVFLTSGVVTGTPFDINVMNWLGGQHPESARLVAMQSPPPAGFNLTGETLNFDLSPTQPPGGYNLHTTVPNDVPPGPYAIAVEGGGVSVHTNVFTVAEPSVPAPIGSQPHVQSVPLSTTMLPTGLLEVMVAGLLLFVIGSLVHSAIRQRVARGPLAPEAGNERQ